MFRYKIVFLLMLVLSIVSCTNKSVQLPQLPISGESEIQNHSQIWVFYAKNKDSVWADANLNNKINSTHWIVNIDKRLTLGELAPVLKKIHYNRYKESMHSKGDVKAFLSYSDTGNKKIALFPIDSVQFIKQELKEYNNWDKKSLDDTYILFTTTMIFLNKQKYNRNEWEAMSLDSIRNKKIHLSFSQNLNYQDYMFYRLLLKEKLPKGILIDKTEHIIID